MSVFHLRDHVAVELREAIPESLSSAGLRRTAPLVIALKEPLN